MILVADMVRNLCPHIATDAVARRTSEGFATVMAKVAPSAADSDAPVGAEQKGQSTCLPMK